MGLDNNRIYELFKSFSGLPEDKAVSWRFICENSGEYLKGRIKPKADTLENRQRLCTAAAAIAYADYILLASGAAGNATQIKIGDISFGESSGSPAKLNSGELKKYFLEQVADLLVPDNGTFAFMCIGEDKNEHKK